MPTEQDLGPLLSGRLAYLLKRASLELESLHGELLTPLGVNARELSVLLLLDGLEGKGLVGRRPDAADRRRNVIELTSNGRKTLTKATRASDQAEQRLLATLTDVEATQLRGAMRRIAAA